ncbi:MAG: hypothetical protein IME96_12830 [Proteobacteria bacterium]|nr:hypothetical protein [Pseudomonadota bacterium]
MKFYRVWLQVTASRGENKKGTFSLYYEAKSTEHLHEILEGGGKCPNRTDASVLEIKPVSRDEYEAGKVLEFKQRYIRENC